MSGLVHYPFKLRPDVWVHLYLPDDFSSADAVRLEEFLKIFADLTRETEKANPPHCPRCGSYKWIYKGGRQVCADCGR
jgi:hypothetical protein